MHGIKKGTTIGVIKEDTRSLDHSSFNPIIGYIRKMENEMEATV